MNDRQLIPLKPKHNKGLSSSKNVQTISQNPLSGLRGEFRMSSFAIWDSRSDIKQLYNTLKWYLLLFKGFETLQVYACSLNLTMKLCLSMYSVSLQLIIKDNTKCLSMTKLQTGICPTVLVEPIDGNIQGIWSIYTRRSVRWTSFKQTNHKKLDTE